MTHQKLWLNVYRSGYYHCAGKPAAANLHAGDVYLSEADAKRHAEPHRGYVATVPFHMPLPPDTHVLRNSDFGNPLPLALTREFGMLPWFGPDLQHEENGAIYA